jgi:hypothetical protein
LSFTLYLLLMRARTTPPDLEAAPAAPLVGDARAA